MTGPGGRLAVPQIVDQAVGRHDLVGMQEEHREERALLGGAQRELPLSNRHLEWAEEPELEIGRTCRGHGRRRYQKA